MPNKRKVSVSATVPGMDSFPMRALQKKRTTNFREDETKLLISLWGSPVIQNKLYLTHRKAPVMRLLAANMQQRGYYRSPDEIKTRIRNLKCLYHRIKRSMVTGAGIGTVDPDWPHFKAMDAILGKQANNKHEKTESTNSEDNLEGPRCEDIKQENELDINDEIDSWNGNESVAGSDYEENHIPATTIAKVLPEPASPITPQITTQIPPVLSLQAPAQTNQQLANPLASFRTNGTNLLPLLILNHGIQPPPQAEKKPESNNGRATDASSNSECYPSDLTNILQEILKVQNQQLELEKEKFELEKQRLEFDRVVGTQLMTLVPMVGGLLQRLVFPPVVSHNHNVQTTTTMNNEAQAKSYTDKSDFDILKDSKILRTVLERGIKKYMMADEAKDNDEDTDNEEGANDGNLLLENDNSNSNSK